MSDIAICACPFLPHLHRPGVLGCLYAGTVTTTSTTEVAPSCPHSPDGMHTQIVECPEATGQQSRGGAVAEDREWQHAASLSIAEGRPGWDQSSDMDSPAMVAVRALRTTYEAECAARERLTADLRYLVKEHMGCETVDGLEKGCSLLGDLAVLAARGGKE